jgi:small subunit ribosomal protein S27e
MDLISTPKSKFVHVMCKKCKNKQVIFSKASTEVKCLVCGEVLAEPSGGDAIIKAKVLEVFG